MSTIKNKIKLSYTFNEENYDCETELELSKQDPIKPSISLTKQGSPNNVGIGDTITYYITINVADGDDIFGEELLCDVIDESTDFVVGSLKINGVVSENQDLSNIEIELAPNTTYQVEYQCIRTRL